MRRPQYSESLTIKIAHARGDSLTDREYFQLTLRNLPEGDSGGNGGSVMKIKAILACGTAATLLAFSSADAATINLVDLGGVTGSVAEKDFNIAAKFWGSMFTNNATINLGVGFNSLPPNVIGSTGSNHNVYLVQDWVNGVNATKSNSALDQSAVLPTLNPDGGTAMILNGPDGTGQTNTSTADQIYADGTVAGNYYLDLNTAVIKAVGGTVADPNALDGAVTFSSDFSFDFDPTNGITAGQMDFLGVAIHEIGHALGFVSGVDIYDYYGGPNGPAYGYGYDINDYAVLSALDMFRYSNDPNGVGPGGPQLDATVGTASYFSIDGGQTALFGNTFATGTYNGDGDQASHWKDSPTCNGTAQLGVMDPTFCYGQMGAVKALDLAAFDAIGWNLNVDALANNGSYVRTTSQIYASLAPEPGTWALMLGGFGAVGFSLRRRRTMVSFG